jgi:hypothetical protein
MVKLAARVASAGALTIAAVTLTATAASAHHAEVTASANCSGVVSFTSTSWEGQGAPGSPDLEASRTNPTIEVAWGTGGDSGAFTVLPQKPAYRFGADNGFTFSDTITPSPALAPGTAVTVRVLAAAPFANGIPDGQPRYATTTIPAPCTVPTVAVMCPASVVVGTSATYTATPTGDGPFTYQWSLNGAPITGATNSAVSVTRNAPTDAVAVTVTDSHGQTASASAPCMATVPPSATVATPNVQTAAPTPEATPEATPPAEEVEGTTDDTPVTAEDAEAQPGVEGEVLEAGAAADAGSLAATGTNVSSLLLAAFALLGAGVAMTAGLRANARRR